MLKTRIRLFPALILLVSLTATAFSAPTPVAYVLQGADLQVRRSGDPEWLLATRGLPLYEGDTLRTSREGRGEFVFPNGSRQHMRGGSTVQIRKQGLLRLIIGEIWLTVTRVNRNFQVETPSVTAAVEGTQFDVKVTPDGDTTVQVAQGQVSLSNALGNAKLKPAQEAVIPFGNPPSPVVMVDVPGKPRWVGETAFHVIRSFPAYFHDPDEALKSKLYASKTLRRQPFDTRALQYLAMVELDKGKGDRADFFLRKVQKPDSLKPAFLLLAARAQYLQGHFEEAVLLQKEALASGPDMGLHEKLILGEYLMDAGHFEDGETQITGVLRIHPDYPHALQPLATLKMLTGNPGEAEGLLRKALAKPAARETKSALWRDLGTVLDLLGRYEEAVRAYQEALAITPGDFATAINMAGALRHLGQLDRAVQLLVSSKGKARTRAQLAAFHFDLAQLYMASGKIRDAGIQYRISLRHNPNQAWARLGLGKTLDILGRRAEALDEYKRASDIEPGAPYLLNALAQAYQGARMWGKAEETVRKTLRLDPEDLMAHGVLTSIYFNSGREKEAQKELARYKELQATELSRALPPVTPWDYLERSRLLARSGQTKDALSALEKGMKTPQKSGLYYWTLGQVYEALRDFGQAEEAYRNALHERETIEQAALALARVYLVQKRPDDGEKAVRYAIDRKRDSYLLWVELSSVLEAQGKYDQAVSANRRAASLSRSEVPAMAASCFASAGLLLERQDKLKEARANYEEAIRLIPTGGRYHMMLGGVLRKLKRLGLAQKELEKAIELSAWNPKDGALAQESLALLLFEQKRTDEAIRRVRKAMEMNPDEPLYPAVLGSMLLSTGDISGARSAYELAIQSAGADPSYQASLYVSLSGISEREGKLSLALEELRKAAALAPGNWQYQSLLAGLLARGGNPREAINAYDLAIAALLEAPPKIPGQPEKRDRILSQHYAMKATIHQLLKEDKEALEALDKAASLDKTNPQIFLATATMALRRAEMDAFFRNIGTVVKLLEGKGAQGHGATLQLAYLWNGEAAKASALGRKLLAKDPKSAYVLRLLGLSETYLGNFKEGTELLEKFLGADSADPHTRGQTLAFLGYLEMRMGKWKEVEERLQSSLAADPSLWSSHVLLAALYYDQLTAPEKGGSSLKKALELVPGDPDALGGSLLARKLDPGDPLAPYTLAVVYLSVNQKDKGKEVLDGIPPENPYKNLRQALEKMF